MPPSKTSKAKANESIFIVGLDFVVDADTRNPQKHSP